MRRSCLLLHASLETLGILLKRNYSHAACAVCDTCVGTYTDTCSDALTHALTHPVTHELTNPLTHAVTH